MAETGLVKFEIPKGLTPIEESIVLASKATRIFHMEEKELKNLITTTLTMALFDLGQSMPTSDRQILESRLKEDLIKYFGKFTSEEIKKAIEMGVRGEFKSKEDEVIFISIKGIHEWVKKYGNKVKVEAIEKFRILNEKREKEQEEQNKEERITQLDKLTRESVIQAFNDFKEGKEIYDPLNVIYDYMDSKGLIKLTNDRKRVIYDQCMNEYKVKHEKGTSVADYLQNKKILQEIEAGSSRIQAIVKTIAKNKALKIVFQDVIELELTMEEYLE